MKHTLCLPALLLLISTLHAQPQSTWSKTTAVNGEVTGTALLTDRKANLYTIGIFNGVALFDTLRREAKGATDMFVQKLGPAGNVQWVKCFGGSGNDDALAIALDIFDNIYVSGSFENTIYFDKYKLTSQGDADAFLVKINPSGKVLWAKSIGGRDFDSGAGVATDRNNSVYLTGEFADSLDLDPGPGKATFYTKLVSGFLVKLDADGGFVWGRAMGSATAVGTDPQGRIITAGETSAGQPGGAVTQWTEPAPAQSGGLVYVPTPDPAKPTAPATTNPVRPAQPAAPQPATQPVAQGGAGGQTPAPPTLLTAPPLNSEEKVRAQKVVEAAQFYLGTPYLRAGVSREGIDCSGLCMVAYQTIDITLPHKSTIIAALVSVKISPLKDLEPGDIVCFNSQAPDGRVDHVGLVTRNEGGKVYFIHATSSKGVIENELSQSDHWLPRYRYSVRPVREGSIASRLARLPYFEIGD